MSALSAESLQQFGEEGYVVVDDVLDVDEDINPVVDEYTALLDRLVTRWYAEGALPSQYKSLPFWQRLLKVLESDLGDTIYSHLDISLPGKGITTETPIHTGVAVFNLLRSERLLDVVESLIGPEIYSNPVQHVRIKMPARVSPESRRDHQLVVTTDWHQDQGVVLPEADQTNILTVWLALTDAGIENGCLAVVPRSHSELMPHCPGRLQLAIPEQLQRRAEAVPAPVKRGGALFMHKRMMHSSLPNRSDSIRWSFDLRYNPIGQPTGRPAFPGFVARSRRDPASEVRDPAIWTELWHSTRSRLADLELGPFNRWSADAPVCA
jgi:hypothetical protein